MLHDIHNNNYHKMYCLCINWGTTNKIDRKKKKEWMAIVVHIIYSLLVNKFLKASSILIDVGIIQYLGLTHRGAHIESGAMNLRGEGAQTESGVRDSEGEAHIESVAVDLRGEGAQAESGAMDLGRRGPHRVESGGLERRKGSSRVGSGKLGKEGSTSSRERRTREAEGLRLCQERGTREGGIHIESRAAGSRGGEAHAESEAEDSERKSSHRVGSHILERRRGLKGGTTYEEEKKGIQES